MDGVANNGAVARERGAEVEEREGAGGDRGGSEDTLGSRGVVLKWAFEGGGRGSLFHSLGRRGSAVF